MKMGGGSYKVQPLCEKFFPCLVTGKQPGNNVNKFIPPSIRCSTKKKQKNLVNQIPISNRHMFLEIVSL